MSSNGQLPMMFAAAPGDDAGLAYVREYVGAQLAVGRLPAEILASFGAAQADPGVTVDTAELCRMVLAHVHAVQEEQLPRALVAAAREGRVDEAVALLEAGAPWDAIDERGHSAGAYALRDGHALLLEKLLDAGSCSVLAEVEPGAAFTGARAAAGARAPAGMRADTGAAGTASDASSASYGAAAAAAAAAAPAAAPAATTAATAFEGEHASFLRQRLRFEAGKGGEARLMDELDRPVMMGWERPLMEAHARALCPSDTSGRVCRVLNIGFGLGLVDEALQRRRPTSHTIIEAHPDVLARMKTDGWPERPGVAVLAGTWQQLLPPMCDPASPPFDAIFFDTFAEGADELFRLQALLPGLLAEGGVYSYFNGIASHDAFLHRVYCTAVTRHLAGLGLSTRFEPVAVPGGQLTPEAWDGAEAGRNWWGMETYLLPVCVRLRE